MTKRKLRKNGNSEEETNGKKDRKRDRNEMNNRENEGKREEKDRITMESSCAKDISTF